MISLSICQHSVVYQNMVMAFAGICQKCGWSGGVCLCGERADGVMVQSGHPHLFACQCFYSVTKGLKLWVDFLFQCFSNRSKFLRENIISLFIKILFYKNACVKS